MLGSRFRKRVWGLWLCVVVLAWVAFFVHNRSPTVVGDRGAGEKEKERKVLIKKFGVIFGVIFGAIFRMIFRAILRAIHASL